MVIKLRRVGKGFAFLLMILVLSMSNINFSSCQSCYQFQAYIWVDRGCGSSYSEGDPISIYYVVEVTSVPCGSSESPPDDSESPPDDFGRFPVMIADQSQFFSIPSLPPSGPPSTYDPIATVSIIDHYPNQAGSHYLVLNEQHSIGTIGRFDSFADCIGSEGLETVELIAVVFTDIGPLTTRSTCSFYVHCSYGGYVLLSDGGSNDSSSGSSSSSGGSGSLSAPACYDNDEDGYTTCDGDRNDYNASVYPGAEDICDEVDNDNDGTTDEDCDPSSILLAVFPVSLPTGETVTISGNIAPPRATSIMLTFTKPNGESFTHSVDSGSDGTFSYSFEPDSPGTWAVSASTENTSHYRGATSNMVSFNVKVKTHISLNAAPSPLSLEENVEISGNITPVRVTAVVITIEDGEGILEEHIVTTSSDGRFSLSYTPDHFGIWYVSASVESTSEYTAATSEKKSFHVKKIETFLTLSVSPTLLYPGGEMKIEGNITPAMSAIIALTIEDGEGNPQEKEVTTSPNGTFSLSYNPEKIGTWSVSAKFSGTQKYESSISRTVSFTVTREESAISLNISENRIAEFNPVKITGEIRPSRSTTVYIYLENDSGELLNFQVLSEKDGTFFYTYTPESEGVWSVYAQVPEEARYASATSLPVSLTVIPAVPDLAVSNLTVNSSVEPGEEVQIHVEVENLGTGTAKEITVVVTASVGMDEILIHKTTVSEINAGDWRSLNVKWVAVSGVDTVIVQIDPSNSISELSEENNRAAQTMDIRFNRDISVTDVFFSSDKIKEGEIVTITAEIQYEGEGPLRCEVKFWDGKPERGTLIDTKVLNSSQLKSFVETLWTAEPGDHLISVVADSQKEVHEFDEDNNTFEKEATVEETLPLIEITLLITATSAGIYWYLKHLNRSISRPRKPPNLPHEYHTPRHAPGFSRGVEPAGEFNPSTLYRAGKALLKAGQTTAATEIGARLYKTLYNKYYRWSKARPVDFEEIVKHKQDLLDKVIAHLFVFEGYIDTGEFCRFFSVDESELMDMLEFLQRDGYIERAAS